MKKTFQYRIYPTRKQQTTLNRWLALCCETYNAALQERRDAYRMAGVSLGFAQQCAELPACKDVRPELAEVNAQVLQNVVKRVDLAFQAFFRGCATGERIGYPRYRSRSRYASLTFPGYASPGNQGCFSFARDGKLVLSKIGHVKLVQHRPLKGIPRTAIVKRSTTGKWYVSICCDEVEPVALPASPEHVGIDVGLKAFAYLSDGQQIDNPRFFRQEEHALAKANRRLAKTEKRTQQRRRRKQEVSRVHERIRHRRENFVQQHTRRLVNGYGLIAVEALVVRNLVKNNKLAKSIADASWSAFFQALCRKAEEAGRTVLKVPPAHTSRTCSGCGHRQDMPLSVRVYECEQCELVLDRDHNASRNILHKAVGRHG